MSGTETTPADGGDNQVEAQTESSDATEHLKMKLSKINNELQDTMKICENYKEDKQIAEKAKNELESSKRKITDLERRLADSESNCKRYRNERNNLRRDIARLIDDRKQMISYEQDVQKLQRDIEMLKNKYDRDIREWKNKLSDTENRYEEIIKEQKLKAETAEQEVQKLRKDLGANITEDSIDKQRVNTTETEPGEVNGDAKPQSGEPDQPKELVATGGIHVKGQMDEIKREGTNGTGDYDIKLDENIDNPKIGADDGLDSLNGINDSDTRYALGQEQHDDYDRGDSSKYKIKRHKVIKEYHTIETRDIDDEPEERSRDTNRDITEQSQENPDDVVEEADTTNKSTWKNEVAIEEHKDPGETQVGPPLSERYQHLYDNQWKNTYEKLRHHFDSDRETITALLEILQDIMNFCKRKAREQIEDMYRILTFSTEKRDENISEKITKHLKDCMREISDTKTYLYEIYPSSFRKKPFHPANYDEIVESFVKECFEICWLIVIEDQSLDFRALNSDQDELDSDVYNPFRNAGQYIDYIVWPPLQLTRDGSVFAKGIAEGSETRQVKHHEVLGLDNDADKEHSLMQTNGHRESIERERKQFDRVDEKNVTDFHNIDKSERYTRRTKYNYQQERELADRDTVRQRNSFNVGEGDDIFSEKQEYTRNSGDNRYADESDLFKRDNTVLEDKLRYERKDVTSETTRVDKSSRVHFNERDEIRYKSHDDSRYDRGYKKESRFFESCNESRRGENLSTEDHLDLFGRHHYTPAERSGAQPLHAFDITEETRPSYPMSIIKTKAKGTANVWTPSYGYERDPTPEEMRLYHRYIDNHDHTGARDVLGNAAYLRCLRKDHTQHFYR